MNDTLFTKNNAEGGKRSLILAGGGVRVAYQAGVLQALEDAGLRFDHIDGTSGGIFNTAMLASGLSPYQIAERWRSVKLKSFMSMNRLREYLRPMLLKSLGSADGIRKKLFPSLGIDLEKIRNNDRVTATFNVCNFSDKSIESIAHREVTENHLIAGVSLPVLMPAVLINDKWYSDAVWIKDANLLEAVKRGSEEIWLIWVIGNCEEYLPGSFNQYVHMIEMSANGALLEEYAQIERINEQILNGNSPYGQTKSIKLHVIKPDFPIPLDPDLFLDKINTSTLINMGYADASRYLRDIPEAGIKFGIEATKMKSPGVTFSFRNRFRGKLQFADGKSFVSYNLSFIVRRLEKNQFSVAAYSGIYLESLNREIPTLKNTVKVRQDGANRFLLVSSEFLHEGKTHFLEAVFKPGAIIDWFLGLEFKKVKLHIKSADETTFAEGYLTQSVKDRLKSVFNSSIRNFYEPGIKSRQKYKLLRALYDSIDVNQE